MGKASILMSVGLGILWLRERLTRLQSFGALLALSGVLVITFQPGDYLRLGALLVLASAFMYALHTAIVKRFGEKMDFVEFFFFRIFATTVLLLFETIPTGQQLLGGLGVIAGVSLVTLKSNR